MLCAECKAVFKQPLTFVQKQWQLDHWSSSSEYNITLSGLEQKATQCYGCRGILRQLVASQKDLKLDLQADVTLQIVYSLNIQTDQQRGYTLLWNGAILEGQKLGMQILRFQRAPEEDVKCDSSSTDSAETLEFVKTCLNVCRTQHETCSTATSPPWYPTRLIEVESNGVRLVESAETAISGPYASLSHCWGGAKIPRLTKSTLEALKKEVPFCRLPQTFQDAIQVTRSLGIRYIWIDSLCIIQDSDEDWKKEALTMLDVYKHAAFSLAASHSANSFGGLFRSRQTNLIGSDVVDIDNGVLKGRFHLIDEYYFIQEVDDAPLNRRCWVTQERMLSRRIIHFTSEQVIWDCAELTACEALPQGTEVWKDSGKVQLKVGCKHGSHFLTTPRTIDEGLAQWARIVNTYSACGLTVLGDKPIAIFGVAEHLRNELKVEYCAGLWRSKLEIQLAWQVKQLQPDRSPRNDLAPSWSWISVNGEVKLQQIDLYEGYNLEPLACVTEVSLGWETKDARGEKLVGYLKMRCSLNPVKLGGDDQSYRLEGNGMEHARRAWTDAPDVVGAAGLFYVPLFEIQMALSFQEKWKVASEIQGIIVQGVEGKPGTYRRCGHAFLSDTVREDTRAFEPADEAVKSSAGKAELPCEKYDSSLGHLITLV